MSDILYIRELEVQAIIGIYDWEREVHQRIHLDLELQTSIRKAAESDDIQEALNYKTLCKRLVTHIENNHFLLVEALAESVAQLVLDEFDTPWVRLKISKPGAVRNTLDVGLCIERGQRS